MIDVGIDSQGVGFKIQSPLILNLNRTAECQEWAGVERGGEGGGTWEFHMAPDKDLKA